MTHAVIVTPDHGEIITSMISLNSATGHARPKELLRQIKNADEICVLHEGQIVERGTHEELLKIDGYYKKLHDMQA